MNLIFLAIVSLLGISAEAGERKLVCRLSLPSNQNLTLEESIESGAAKIQHVFRVEALKKDFLVESEVWGFEPDHPYRVAGYLSIKQLREDPSIPQNYAINHCELKSFKEACNLELVVMLNGAGAGAKCSVPGI